MDTLGVRWTRVLLAAAAILATSCSKGPGGQPAAGSTSSPAAQQTAASGQPSQPAVAPPGQAAVPPGAVIASGQYSANPDLRCDLMEVKRVSGGAVLVKWRVVNAGAAPAPGGLTASQPKPINYDGHWADLYFIDPAENKKYSYLTDAGGQGIVDVYWGDLAAGQQHANWAKFPAPPATSTKIAVHIPSFPPFEDVPVSQ